MYDHVATVQHGSLVTITALTAPNKELCVTKCNCFSFSFPFSATTLTVEKANHLNRNGDL